MKNPFSSPQPVEHEVGGQMFNFYPCRTWTVGKLKGFLRPVFAAIASFSQNTETDVGRDQVDETDATGSMSRRISLTAIDPKLAQQRTDQRERIINTLVDSLTSQQALRSLALMVVDSMRDDFEGKPKDSDLDELVNEWTLDDLAQGLHGVYKASKELFVPLMDRVGVDLSTLTNRLKKVQDDEPPSGPEEPSEATTATPTDSGETSSKA